MSKKSTREIEDSKPVNDIIRDQLTQKYKHRDEWDTQGFNKVKLYLYCL